MTIKFILIFVLKLENAKYFIGKTANLDFQLQDFNYHKYLWTKKYNPKLLVNTIKTQDDYDEDKETLKYIQKYGIENVRGGSYTDINLDNCQIKNIELQIKTATKLATFDNYKIISNYHQNIKNMINKYYGVYNFYLLDLKEKMLYYYTINDLHTQNIEHLTIINIKNELISKKASFEIYSNNEISIYIKPTHGHFSLLDFDNIKSHLVL
jgi:hypothetical protein